MNVSYENNMVSIITPAYNCEKYISNTITSVINQTYSCWEMIIINDFSTDETKKIISTYAMQDIRIKLVNLKCNSGVAEARNVGILLAKGRYIAFLDSDDLWLPTKLQKQLSFMQEKKAAFSYAQYRQFVENVNKPSDLIDVCEEISYDDLLKGNIIGCLTVMIDREYIHQIVMPNQRHEDYITWLSILKQGFVAHGLKEDVARYRKTDGSLSGNKKRSALWTWKIYRNHERLSLIKSLYCFSCYIKKNIIKHYM